MSQRIRISAVIAALIGILASCNQIEIPGVVEEGLPTKLKLALTMPAPGEVVVTKATDAQETAVSELALFFYKKSNTSAPAAVIEIGQDGLQNYTQPSSTNYIYTITCEDESLTSGEYYLYAIGNYGSNNFGSVNIASLKSKSLDDLKATMVTKGNHLLDMIENTLLMTGVYGRGDGSITLAPGANDFTSKGDASRIHLRRITAKVNFRISAAAGINFEPISYSIVNYPMSSTLFERRGWAPDDINGTIADNLNGSETDKELDELTGLNIADNGFQFYMMENAQVADTELSSYAQREAHVSPDDQSFMYAPEASTYVVIKGRYSGPLTTQGASNGETINGMVSYTVHLGNFSTSGSNSNFAVRRNSKYNYRITITGVNSIIAEAEYNGEGYVEGNPGAEGSLYTISNSLTDVRLDSHYESVLVKIADNDGQGHPLALVGYTIRSLTPYEDETYDSIQDADKTQPQDVNWVRFAAPTSTTDLISYPGAENTVDIYGLVAEFREGRMEHFKHDETNHFFYTQAFVSEYFYETNPVTGQPALPAEFVNVEDRELTLAAGIAVSKDGKSTYAKTPIFSIKQQPIVTMYDLSSDNMLANPFGIETIEEFRNPVYLSPDGEYQDNLTSQSSSFNGWANMTAILSANQWGDYVDSSKMGHFDNSSDINAAAMSQNYAAYQCLSRNRDENGNGTIDNDEIKWYLPAGGQCQTIWYGYPALKTSAHLNNNMQAYWTSTTGSMRAWYLDEGVSYGEINGASSWLASQLGVRCVRNLVAHNQAATPCSSYDSETRVVDVSGLGNGAVRESGSVTKEYLPHQRNESPDQLPEAFQIAKANLNIGGTPEIDNTTTFTDQQVGAVKTLGKIKDLTATITLSDPGTSGEPVHVFSIGEGVENKDEERPQLHFYYYKTTTTKGNKTTYKYSLRLYKFDESHTQIEIDLISTQKEDVPPSPVRIIYTPSNVKVYHGDSQTAIRNEQLSSFASSNEMQIMATGNSTVKADYTAGEYTPATPGKSAFTFEEATQGNWCNDYYYEEPDKSDLHKWRIPNEKEFGLMIEYISSEFESSDTRPVARSTYYRKYDTNKVFAPYTYDPVQHVITCKTSVSNMVLRCVRDVATIALPSSVEGSNSGSYTSGGNGLQ